MARVLLMGYRALDFSPQDDPNKHIKGFNVFLGCPHKDVEGFIPVSDGGKRFLGEQLCNNLGITKKFLDDNLFHLLEMDVDFNGKIISCAACKSE